MTHGTASEMATARRWVATFSTGELPISFLYGDQAAAESIKTWPNERASRPLDSQRVEHIANYHDRATGLVVRGVAIEYADFPAVEWVVHFGNAGVADTPILSDILPLDVLFPLDAAAPCQVHHARGGLTQTDDFEPLKTPLTFRQGGSKLELSARTGKSSTLHLPFFNLEMGGGGVIGAIGWSGGWKAGFQRQRDGIQVRAGMETHPSGSAPGRRNSDAANPVAVLGRRSDASAQHVAAPDPAALHAAAERSVVAAAVL